METLVTWKGGLSRRVVSYNVPIGCPPAATLENANKILTHAMGYGYCNGKDLRAFSHNIVTERLVYE